MKGRGILNHPHFHFRVDRFLLVVYIADLALLIYGDNFSKRECRPRPKKPMDSRRDKTLKVNSRDLARHQVAVMTF